LELKKIAVVAGFYSGGNNAYDTNDVPKISNPSETLAFYTDTRSLSSEHRAPIQDNDFLMLRLTQTTVNSNYKLKIFTEDFSYTGQALLQDLFLNTITPFSVDGSVFEYDFVVTADALSSGNRFKIIFQNTLSNSTFSQENNFVIYPNPTTFEQGIHISTQQPSSEIYEYRIYNYLGQIVETNKITFDNQLTNISFSQKLNQGIYFLNIYDNQNVLQSSKSILIK